MASKTQAVPRSSGLACQSEVFTL
jgi:hypothetical protein